MRFALLLLLIGCPAADDDDSALPDACAHSEPGRVQVLTTGFRGSEGLTFSDDGRLFVGDQDLVAEVFPDGTWAEVASVPTVIGLAWWNGSLMAASSDSGVGNGLDGVHRIDADTGDVELVGEGIPGANFLTVTPWDTLLVTDPRVDAIQELTADGEVTTWLPDLLSPNGTAFTADRTAVWSVTTYADPQPVWRTPVTEGSAGVPVEVASFGAGDVSDGVAVGQSGDLYIVQNIGGRIDRVSADGQVELVADGVPWGASIAFGEGPDWDGCALYATSLFGPEIFVIDVGEPGLAPLR